jgi:hypothetical protein
MNDHQEPIELPVERARPRGMQIVGVVLLLLAMGLSLSYAWRERNQAQQLAASRDDLRASLVQTQSQVDALMARLNTLSTTQAAAQAPSAPVEEKAAAEKTQHRTAKHASVKHQAARQVEDPRWKQVQAELAEHQKQIQETQANVEKARADLEGSLNSTRDELGGSIARNHEELVELQKRGERNYTEFDLSKSKQFQRVGPLSVSLRKANTKHEYCDLEMLVNDNQLSKKHVNLYEPVLFYPQGYSQPLEIVINGIDKDSAHGYVSEPKYKPPELATSAAASTPAASASTSTATLEHRPPTEP